MWILHLFLKGELFLTFPKFFSSEWITRSIERSDVFGDIHLVLSNHHLSRELLLILEPGVGDTQIKIASYFNSRVSPQKDLPMIIHWLKNWSETNVQHTHVFPAERIPEYLNFLSFRIGNNLSSNINLVGSIEDIKSEIVGKISEVNLLQGWKTKLNNMLNFLPCNLNIINDIHRGLFSWLHQHPSGSSGDPWGNLFGRILF